MDEINKNVIDAAPDRRLQRRKRTKVKSYSMLNKFVKKGQILFIGSSLMEFFPINEMQNTLNLDHIIYNRGIAGFVTSELLSSMDECIFDLSPSKIFINIGTNDMNTSSYRKENLIKNYDNILNQIGSRLPDCRVYVMAYYPVNAEADFPGQNKEFKEKAFKTRTNAAIAEANKAVQELAKKHNYEFINVNDGITDEEGNLKEEFSIEGMHMWPNAYEIILNNMKKYL